MQRLRRGRLVLHHRDPDIVRAGIAAVALFTREIAPRYNANTRLGPQALCYSLAATLFRDVQPEEKSAGRALIPVTVADDLIGEIELLGIEPAVIAHMYLVVISGDRHILGGCWDLRRRDVPQFKVWREKSPVAGGEADAQAGQARALRQ